MGYKEAIHNMLVETAAAGEFVEAVYSVEHPSLLSRGGAVLPRSVETNEIRGAYVLDSEYGREYRQKRAGWAWLLIIRFDTEAICEDFEETLLNSPLMVARNTSEGRDEQVMLLLEDSSYEHPPRGGASNGTQVTYRFVADLC